MNKEILLVALTVLLGGCVSIPEYKENKQAIIENSQETINYGLAQKYGINKENWWLDFNDNQLNELMQKVKENNIDLKIAKLNVEKSESYEKIIESNNYPNVNLSSVLTREKLSGTGMTPPPYAGSVLNIGQIGLNSRYTIDYLNKNALLLDEQKEKNDGFKEQVKNVELNIYIQVIKAYIYYQYLIQEESVIKEQLTIQNEIIDAYKKGIAIGKYTINQMNDIENQFININTNLNTIEQNKQTTINILIQLTGNSNIYLTPSTKVWSIKENVPMAKVDIKLIGQRPDIKYYFANINAQRNHFKALKADFYPSFSLTGDIGFQKVGLSDLVNKKSLFWNIGPEISLPIFDAGKIKTNYKIAGIDLNIFIENYNNAVYAAIKEVNTSLMKEKIAYQQLENQEKVYHNYKKNNNNINQLFENGKVSKLMNLESTMELWKIKEQSLNNEFNYINAKIDIIQSLGGK